MNSPCTAKPCWRRICAVTAESTPPDSASSTLSCFSKVEKPGALLNSPLIKTPRFLQMRRYLNLAASATAMASQRSFSLWPAWPFTQW